MVPNSIKIPVASEVVLPKGAMYMRTEANIDFDKKKQGLADHWERNDAGLRIWTLIVSDLEQPEEGKFGGSTELKVKIASEHQPVIPSPQVEGFPPKIEFTGMLLSPWRDDRKCTGKSAPHRCGAKLSWSISATGVIAWGTSGNAENA